jgi:hypothetical protein
MPAFAGMTDFRMTDVCLPDFPMAVVATALAPRGGA